MIRFRLYLEILAVNVGISVFAVLAVAAISGIALTVRVLIFPIVTQALLTSLVFFFRELVRLRDARIIARALAQRTAQQLAVFNNAVRNQAGFSGGIRPWNS